MIAIRSHSKRNCTSKPCNSNHCSCKPAGSLVRGLESLYTGVSNLGTALVGRSAMGKSVVRTMPTKSTVGSDSLGTESNAERECGA